MCSYWRQRLIALQRLLVRILTRVEKLPTVPSHATLSARACRLTTSSTPDCTLRTCPNGYRSRNLGTRLACLLAVASPSIVTAPSIEKPGTRKLGISSGQLRLAEGCNIASAPASTRGLRRHWLPIVEPWPGTNDAWLEGWIRSHHDGYDIVDDDDNELIPADLSQLAH